MKNIVAPSFCELDSPLLSLHQRKDSEIHLDLTEKFFSLDHKPLETQADFLDNSPVFEL